MEHPVGFLDLNKLKASSLFAYFLRCCVGDVQLLIKKSCAVVFHSSLSFLVGDTGLLVTLSYF